MEISNGKYEDNDFATNSMEQMSKIFTRSCQNKYSGKGDIRTDFSEKTFDENAWCT